ncbi:Phosphoglycerate kinase [Ferroglobus placidus DSM 10642]|uniref:Phosphoglycerate kinase n=1 Tax=Ferroglobus placidus (strain DSM 10642 / AEDII12DO) TaxID=589924 RepID=D3RXS2_FERPA|nr:phosphoglycerate kinase [Ferroglobus placidus]ADC65285.1 Phosphoglycerate kinase [Ferroglobus placidus DSM 10642]
MLDGIPTLDDIQYSGKKVLLRVDINSPIVESRILDTTRFESHYETLKELENSAVAILAHQSRPGKDDFTTLEAHAEVLERIVGREVEYLDEIFSSCVIKRVKRLKPGEIVLLENVRFYSEEQLKRSPEEHANCIMVRKLAPLFDLYVNDAFSASHRPHASLIGFPPVMPSVAGRLVEKEVKALSKALRSEGRKIFILGGAKIEDSVKVLKNVLENGIADKVALTGVVANYFLKLSGFKLGEENEKIIEENKDGVNDEEMKKLLEKYKDKIILPVDVAIDANGEREDVKLEEFKGGMIKDIGFETISMLAEEIPKYDIAVINGPAGVFEEEAFATGTAEVLKAVAKAGYSVVGGGHIATAARLFGIARKIDHISTGGGASIRFLSGESLVALEVLKKYWKSPSRGL